MTSNNVLINDTVRVTVKFVNIDTVTGDPVEVSPTSVSVTVRDGSNAVVTTANATSITESVWYYDFMATEADTYIVEFLGIVPATGNIIVQQKLYVSSLTEDYRPTITLGAEETITFAGEISPLFLDPELLISVFPDATLLEIAEIIHSYSLEVKNLFNLNDDEDGSNLSFIILEYIRASTACELTRTYGIGGDDEVSLRLGDLTITNRNLPRNAITRDNATTWCQIAAALRKEMLANKAGPLAMQIKNLPSANKFNNLDKTPYPGDRELYSYRRKTAYDDPMPGRGLRSYD